MKTGLVLSGGGARCIAHLGLLHGLEEMNIRPGVISGVSAGALIGALYAAGNSALKILEMVKEHSSFSVLKTVLSPVGLFSSAGIREVLRSAIPVDDFGALQIPLYVTATDLDSGVSATFSKGPLFETVVSSTAVPGIFQPVNINGLYYVDGGVLDNLPASCIRDKCDKLIGSHVNKLYPHKPKKWGRLEVMEKCFHLAIGHTVLINSLLCDVFVEPYLGGYTMFETKYADKIFEAGYLAVMEKRETIASWNQSS
ncbi:patatin-like phospholipase family protein [Mucilaginibacter xinganensis]|uniref:O-acetyltransferase n=1 Tax=Mucilaginibacter xinganensis TaxID=1234841 RepID=A0A223NZW9_9SPHI|nr:patatin-like phospholipase family protein [Mucilaginibacter xinganensis]ASU35330.1 O-acetyltransferase [Mucilaginibacter xinganensis]